MVRKGGAPWVLLFVLVAGAFPSAGQEARPTASPDPSAALGRAPWPGMTAWDAAYARDLVWTARLVEVREPDQPPQLVRVTDVRGWKKPNGFYGLTINGEVIDEAWVWLPFRGRPTNLRVLFTYGSDPVRDVSPFLE